MSISIYFPTGARLLHHLPQVDALQLHLEAEDYQYLTFITMSSQLNGYLRKDIFRTRSSSNELFLAPERPNHQLVLRLRLRTPIGTIFTNLDVALNKDGMRIDEISTDQYVIIVRGIPPVHGYNENSVLEIVRQHDNGAEIV